MNIAPRFAGARLTPPTTQVKASSVQRSGNVEFLEQKVITVAKQLYKARRNMLLYNSQINSSLKRDAVFSQYEKSEEAYQTLVKEIKNKGVQLSPIDSYILNALGKYDSVNLDKPAVDITNLYHKYKNKGQEILQAFEVSLHDFECVMELHSQNNRIFPGGLVNFKK